jgi:alkanesulfonate monooxygenase SsuD/methylene tetrahydromethanopterin reductase-like flavin-dependent oxidoreductase (luciferase family)
MQYGIFLPPFGPCADLTTLASLAAEAEAAGWDGFFLWDDITMSTPIPIADTWIALTVIALRTRALRLGALVTPLPRRRPWKLARETVTLDHLSQGRLIVGLGIGAGATEFDDLGEETDIKVRAALLEEGLDILTGLWSGEPFQYAGTHYHIRKARFLPSSFQRPRIPVWVAGNWPARAPFRRAARWDGVFPLGRDLELSEMLAPADVQAMLTFTLDHRAQAGAPATPFDVVHAGFSSGANPDQDRALVQTYADVGVTWWLEHLVPERWGTWADWPLEAMRQRIQQGPPRL